jgi:3-oxoacid CoA-transferase
VRCVSRIITDLAVFDVKRKEKDGGLVLIEIAEGIELEELREKTGAKFEVAKDLKRF